MRDVNAWVLGMLAAPVALMTGSVLAHVISSGLDGFLNLLWWQFVLGILVLMFSMVLSPLPFLLAEWLGVSASSIRKFRWAAALLAPAFVALYLSGQAHASTVLQVAAVSAGVLLNVAVFGAIYTRSNSSSSGRDVSAAGANGRRST